jgi:zinc D-Ala-D-Ala dipeptidase
MRPFLNLLMWIALYFPFWNNLSAQFTNLFESAPEITQDIRYATPDNFVKSKIYDCAACYLRPEAAAALKLVHNDLLKKGYGLKVFDCYRPKDYQQRLWDKKPDARFVTPPSKGSMHGRGLAVDLTLVDKNGKEIDMGTPYDFFGPEAYPAYSNLPTKIKNARKILSSAMIARGFKPIRTEWWHFSYSKKSYPLSNWRWKCK